MGKWKFTDTTKPAKSYLCLIGITILRKENYHEEKIFTDILDIGYLYWISWINRNKERLRNVY